MKKIILTDKATQQAQGPTMHFLKTNTHFFDAVLEGSKRFDVRPNSRNFKVGDTLILVAQEGKVIKPGFVCLPLTFIQFGLEGNCCVLGWTNCVDADQRMKDFYMFNISTHLNGNRNTN